MKKIFAILAFVGAIQMASAQLSTIGGRLSLWGNSESLSFSFVPEVEFELSEHWEIGIGAGVSTVTDFNTHQTTALGEVAPGVSYIIWSNERVEIARAAEAELRFDSLARNGMVGLVPEIRFIPCEHMELGLSLGMLGAEWVREEGWSGGLILNSSVTSVSIAYKF